MTKNNEIVDYMNSILNEQKIIGDYINPILAKKYTEFRMESENYIKLINQKESNIVIDNTSLQNTEFFVDKGAEPTKDTTQSTPEINTFDISAPIIT